MRPTLAAGKQKGCHNYGEHQQQSNADEDPPPKHSPSLAKYA
jgi:hypothetical protein